MFNITVGIPTHKRPRLLLRSLNSLLNDHYSNVKIVVSIDGIDETHNDYLEIEKKFSNSSIEFIYHKENIGSLNNFLFLRDHCKTEYFMWLADDDEISCTTIINLYSLLKTKISACTAVPYWELLNEKNEKKLIKPSFFMQKSLLKRVISYCYNSDDAFFYGLHRTEILKKCSFKGYWWPNKISLSNWCYVFQMDLILRGKIIFLDDKKLKWINHDYGKKFYPRSSSDKFFKYYAYLSRRINVYYLYLEKLLKAKEFIIFTIMIFISFFLLIRDLLFREPAFHKVQFK
tara:strand:+ start:143 stop:1006 length:864 start_codon:yes stop_codon:yes gene_type:complete